MSDKMREDFEKWANQYDYDLTWSELIDNYSFSVTRILFDVWQAAIASVVVELPEIPADSKAHAYSVNVRCSLFNAGIKWKE